MRTRHRPRKESYSVTALVSLNEKTSVVMSTPRKESNSQYDFLAFVLYLLSNKHLVSGDKLMLDNASVHNGKEMEPLLKSILTAAGVELVFLPTYLLELNLCEFVFMMAKRHLRENRTESSLFKEIITAFSKIKISNVSRFYRKCYLTGNPV